VPPYRGGPKEYANRMRSRVSPRLAGLRRRHARYRIAERGFKLTQYSASYDEYPWTTPLLENGVWLGVFALGSFIVSLLSGWAAAAYLGYSLICMYLLMPRMVCTHCSYYGRTCHSGQGRIAGLLFSRGDTASFGSRFKYSRFAAPVFLAPLIIGLVFCALHFTWSRLGATLAFGILALGCTRAVTCGLGCPHCNQRALCPAIQRRRNKPSIPESR